MPHALLRFAVAILLASALAAPAIAQDVRPPSPILEPVERPPREGPPREGVEGGIVPLPTTGNRAAAADRARTVAAVLPADWSSIASRYQPLWDGAGAGFGLERWGSYFAAAGIVPAIAPHPFLSPWGMLSYEGWLFDRYRAAWEGAPASTDRLELAADWLQRGDRAIAEARADDAIFAYRRVTQAAPEYPLGWLALGAALAEAGRDEEAARALRQGLDRYPAWLSPALDWEALYGAPERLVAVQSASAERALTGGQDARFVAAVLHLFGGAPATGRRLLAGLSGDPYAEMLLARGPR